MGSIDKKYKLFIPEKVNKKIAKLDHSSKKIIKAYIIKNLLNTDEPRIHGKALTGNLKGMWRYRIMDYRLIVEIKDNELIIIAIDLEHRSKIYN